MDRNITRFGRGSNSCSHLKEYLLLRVFFGLKALNTAADLSKGNHYRFNHPKAVPIHSKLRRASPLFFVWNPPESFCLTCHVSSYELYFKNSTTTIWGNQEFSQIDCKVKNRVPTISHKRHRFTALLWPILILLQVDSHLHVRLVVLCKNDWFLGGRPFVVSRAEKPSLW